MENANDLFVEASRKQYRFKLNNGNATVEDLWDLNLETLNVLAKAAKKEVDSLAEEDFISAKPAASKDTENKFEILKYVIGVKLAERQAKADAVAKRAKAAQIKELLAEKQNQAMQSKTEAELLAELAALEA